MPIPTEPIGSVPRPPELIAGLTSGASADELAALAGSALVDTLRRFEETGSPVVTDGEQGKSSFVTYPLDGLTGLAPSGAVIPFADGHTRQLPVLTEGPFRYGRNAVAFYAEATRHTTLPVKQAVIAPSALSLLYPADGVPGYSREQFTEDLVAAAHDDIRQCLDAGADSVQLDFTEGRLSVKLDPSKGLLRSFVELNNQVLDRLPESARPRLGVHTCPGGDQDSTHSADVDYAELLPDLFALHVGRVYVQLASEADPERVLGIIRDNLRPDQRVFVGVVDPIDPVVETPEQVRDRVLLAARYIPPEQLGTCDDCGFAPFADDTSTARDVAFAKITARVRGTALAAEELGV
ncbi:MAG TPA: cobalamin-independent methionine synthase II family protein [Pseudonocardiaceae bacterium]